MMTRKGIIMRLDEGQLERDRRRYVLEGDPTDVSFKDDVQLSTLNFEYDDWLHMGKPRTVTVHVYPGDLTDGRRDTLERVYRDSKEDMLLAARKLEDSDEE